MTDFFAAEARAKAARAAAWQKAVDKLSITFEADMPIGGYPACLVAAGSAKARLRLLRDLGFRVVRRWEMDYAILPEDPHQTQEWAEISGGISVSLTEGYVARTRGVGKR